MDLAVYWTDFAKTELKRIFDYHKEKAGKNIAQQIISTIVDKAALLGSFPELGVAEPFLRERSQGFRYIVSTNYKIIYWINEPENRVEIADVLIPDGIWKK